MALNGMGGEAQIIERGSHHRVWKTTAAGPGGQPVERQIIELATGLHYQEQGRWKETQEQFEIASDGSFVAKQGPHKVVLAPNLNTSGAVKVETPDGRRFRHHPLCLAYVNPATGESLVLGRLRSSRGQLIEPNVVLYKDAFSGPGCQADVRYTYRRNGLSQDIIWRQKPADPVALKMTGNAWLEIWTEVVEADELMPRSGPVTTLTDTNLLATNSAAGTGMKVGQMHFAPGNAFVLKAGQKQGLGVEAAIDYRAPSADGGVKAQDPEVPIQKSLETIQGRQFLIESAPYQRLKPLFETLPGTQASLSPTSSDQFPSAFEKDLAQSLFENSKLGSTGDPPDATPAAGDRRAGLGLSPALATKRSRFLPGQTVLPWPPGQSEPPSPIELAASRLENSQMVASAFEPGVVLDYQMVISCGSFTACGDKTYWVTGPVSFDHLILEGGAVLKFEAQGSLTVGGVDCRTTPYHPAVFTSKNDNSLGDPIPGSTGNPSGNGGPNGCDYNGPALAFDYSLFHKNLDLHHLQIRFARQGIVLGSGYANSVKHVQFYKCGYCLACPSGGYFYVGNALFDTCFTALDGYYGTGRAEHLTLFHTYSANYSGTLSLTLANSILVGVPYPGNYSTPAAGVNQVLAENPGAPVFQSVGAGKFYLLDDTYRNSAGSDIDPALREELKIQTTFPPQLFTGAVSTRTVLNPRSIRDGAVKNLGYHYDALDYLAYGVSVSSTLELRGGVAIGLAFIAPGNYRGLDISSGGQVISEGQPLALNRLTPRSTVQEQPDGPCLGWYYLLYDMAGAANPSTIRLRFTDLAVPSGGYTQIYTGGGLKELNVQDSQIRGGYLTYDFSGPANRLVQFNNSLFERLDASVGPSYDNTLIMRAYHNLFYGGRLIFNAATGNAWVWRDNVFDGVRLLQYWKPVASHSHNAYGRKSGDSTYYATVPLQGTDSSNPYPDPIKYQTGPLGRYYLGANTALVNKGSRLASDAGLYHYTTLPTQEKEGVSQVDIGPHYLALTTTPSETIWVDDNCPPGSVPCGAWQWVSSNPTPVSGARCHLLANASGIHQDYFIGASPVYIAPGTMLECEVYLNSGTLPSEIMLQWLASDETWWYHRAYWGQDLITCWGTRTCMGSGLPSPGQWIRLAVPASAVDLEGRTINGMAFTLYNGSAVWDRAALVSSVTSKPLSSVDSDWDGLADYLEDSNGDGRFNPGDTANYQASDSDDDGIPDFLEVMIARTDATNPDVNANGIPDAYDDDDGDGYTNIEELQNGTDPRVFDPPPAPRNFSATILSSSGNGGLRAAGAAETFNLLLQWERAAGNPVGFVVSMKERSNDPLKQVFASNNGGATSCNLSLSFSSFDRYHEWYGPTLFLAAVYQPAGMATPPTSILAEAKPAFCPHYPRPRGSVVRGPNDQWFLVTQPFKKLEQYRLYAGVDPSSFLLDLPASSLESGIYQLPEAFWQAGVGRYIAGQTLSATRHGPSLYLGPASWHYYKTPNQGSYRYPKFHDTRAHLNDNLVFLIRATKSAGDLNGLWQFFEGFKFRYGTQANPFDAPIACNVWLSNYRYEPGIYNYSDLRYPYQLDYDTLPPSALSYDSSKWIYYGFLSEERAGGDIGIGYNSTTHTVQAAASAQNFYGLRYLSYKLIARTFNENRVLVPQVFDLSPGQSINVGNAYDCQVFFETEKPSLFNRGYHFEDMSCSFNGDPHYLLSTYPGASGVSGFSDGLETRLMVTSPGNLLTVAGWAKYQVNYNMNNYAHLGLLFDKAYKIDAAGNPTSVTTGWLCEYGDFFPLEPGPAMLTTLPTTSGDVGKCKVFVIGITLDGNHDGIMDTRWNSPDNFSESFYTADPFVFWVNNDVDREHTVDGNDRTEDDLQLSDSGVLPSQKMLDGALPAAHYQIPSLRDLEDYTRLWLPGLDALRLELDHDYAKYGRYKIELSWMNPAETNPVIHIFKASDPQGGNGYLFNEEEAKAQLMSANSFTFLGTVEGSFTIDLRNSRLSGLGEKYIFCAAKRGRGTLVMRVIDDQGFRVGQATAEMEIKDIKEMYERWTVGDNPSLAPLPTAQIDPKDFAFCYPYDVDADKITPYIVFVHGWNMDPFEKHSFAETAFKRLYWQGYQGRFGAFRWPTRYEFGDKWIGLNPVTNPTHYDASEQIAWRSAAPLRALLATLNTKYPGQVYLLAHSMGNIVAGEALRLAAQSGQQVVNTYVASQAALTAHLYDSTINDPSALLQWTYDHPDLANILEPANFNYGPQTPNIYGDWLAGNSGGAGRRVNFYDPNDFALAQPRWEYNQIAKPQKINEAALTHSPIYWFAGTPYTPSQFQPPVIGFVTGLPQYTAGPVDDNPPWAYFYRGRTTLNMEWLGEPFDLANVQHRYEVMSHAAEARAKALGTVSVPTLSRNVNLAQIWPVDTENPERPYSRHKWHSGQFRMNNMKQKDYWKTILSSGGFNLP